jgi:hypothetical protein
MVIDIKTKTINGYNATKAEVKLVSYGLDIKSAAFELSLLTNDYVHVSDEYINVDNSDILDNLNTHNDLIIDYILNLKGLERL